MSNPLVSVVIPAYNAEEFISEALDSVFSQTYRPIEIIVVDDGSTDRTKEMVKNFIRNVRDNSNKSRQRGDRTLTEPIELKYIYRQNGGPSSARNNGIKTSKGEYIAFLDADDLWMKDKLREQVRLIKEHSDIALVFGDVRRFPVTGLMDSSLFERRNYSEAFFGSPLYVLDAYKKILHGNFALTGSVIIRRKCLEEAGMFDEELRFAEDWDLWLRVALKYSIGYTRKICLMRRYHKENISKALSKDNRELSVVRVLKKHEKMYKDFLANEGIDLKLRFLQSYETLGHIYFRNRNFKRARDYFKKSLSIKFQFRTYLYCATTFLRAPLTKV